MAVDSEKLERTHPVYDRYIDRYLMSEDFAVGGMEVLAPSTYETDMKFAIAEKTENDDMEESTSIHWIPARANSYLFSHEREKLTRFQEREKRAAHLPLMEPILSAYYDGVQAAGSIKYNGEPSLDGIANPTVREFADNPTGTGDTLEEIRNDVALLGMATGACHTYIHIPSAREKSASAYHQQLEAARPFLKIVSPSQLFYWEVDPFGNYTQVRFREILPNINKDGDSVEQIRIVSRDKWSTYVRSANVDKREKWELSEVVNHNLGFVPFTTFYTNRIRWGNNAPIPFFPDLVDFDRQIFNLFSLLNRIDWNQTFDVLAIPSQGATSALNISVYEAISYDASGGVPMYISPDAATAAGLWLRIKEQIQLVRTLIGHGRGISEVSVEARSGAALRYESSQKHSKMLKLANGLKRWQQNTFNIVARALNTSPVDIIFPQQFDVMELDNKIQTLMNLKSTQVNELAIAPIARQVILEVMKRVGASSDEIKKALDDIASKPFEQVSVGPDFRVQGMQNTEPRGN